MEPGLRAAGMRNSEEVVGGHSCRAAWEKMVGGTDAVRGPRTETQRGRGMGVGGPARPCEEQMEGRREERDALALVGGE